MSIPLKFPGTEPRLAGAWGISARTSPHVPEIHKCPWKRSCLNLFLKFVLSFLRHSVLSVSGALLKTMVPHYGAARSGFRPK